MTKVSTVRTLLVALHLVALVSVSAGVAQAQTFISPLLGYDYGDDAGCPAIADCEEKSLNLGIGIGRMGNVFGGEVEIAYADGFFGETPDLTSSLLTVMGNVMIVPNLGPLRPYGTIGLGLMRPRVELDAGSIFAAENQFGWNYGGGLILFFGDHVGVRGDIRRFRSLQELPVVDLPLGDEKITFGRASGAIVLKF